MIIWKEYMLTGMKLLQLGCKKNLEDGIPCKVCPFDRYCHLMFDDKRVDFKMNDERE